MLPSLRGVLPLLGTAGFLSIRRRRSSEGLGNSVRPIISLIWNHSNNVRTDCERDFLRPSLLYRLDTKRVPLFIM